MSVAFSLDHVGFVARDMQAMRAAWQQLGFQPTEPRLLMAGRRGTPEYRSLEQESCHVVLQHGYIELSAVLTDSAAHHLAAWSGRGAGMHILALGTDDVDATRAACSRRGLPVTMPADATRRIDYGERHGDARFRWFMLQPQAAPEGLVCFVHNHTPELVFQPAATAQPNGALALSEVCVSTSDFPAALSRWSTLLGARPDEQSSGGARWVFDGGGALWLADQATLRARFGTAVSAVPPDRFAAVGLTVDSIARLQDALAHAGVANRPDAGSLLLPPAAAGGALLHFTEP